MNGTGIPREPGATIRDSVKKYLPVTVALQIYGGIGEDLEIDTGTPDMVDTPVAPKASSFVMQQTVNARELELERLRGQLAGMQAVMQGMQIRSPNPPAVVATEESEEDEEAMTMQALAKLLVQTRKDNKSQGS